jgi:hypothetical protein
MALAAVFGVLVAAFSLAIAAPDASLTAPGTSRILDLRVVSEHELIMDNDPKFPHPRRVYLVDDESVEIMARTERVARLDVLVSLSGTESFGMFSGRPDREGVVRIEVEVPAAGSMHDWRIPGPDGRRRPGPVRPGTVFMLVPSGVDTVAMPGGGPQGAVVAHGGPNWVVVRE